MRSATLGALCIPLLGSLAGLAAEPEEPEAKPTILTEVTVTDTRESQLKREIPATVDSIPGADLRAAHATHPSEVMGRVPGAWVSVTSGEGHQTAIRQPLTTTPVYLYLEDGVPTRSTGFFNHNALYEVNVPMADGIEVTKGPGSALYGSDAIGGVVNSLTRSPFGASGLETTLDGGSFGWRRALLSGNLGGSAQAARVDANLTHSDGWRDATGYDRQSFTGRWDRTLGTDGLLKTVATYSNVDQQTAGASTLQAADYENNPTLNLTPISFRQVKAFRLSSSYERGDEKTLVSVVPYFRYDEMGILPNWTLTYDPTVSTTRNTSWGVLAKVRRTFEPMRSEAVLGVDVDYSPGSHVENSITPSTTTLSGGQKAFTSYTTGPLIYDYAVNFLTVSPYLHTEFSPVPALRVTAGLRYDASGYSYTDRMTTPQTPRYLRPADTTLDYHQLSPKLGATLELSPRVSLFAAWRHAFRVPSEGQLFRQGSTLNTVGLKPVKADNYEVGLRAEPLRSVSLEVSAYDLRKRDDILTYRDPVDGSTQAVNAGQTGHRGIEVGLSAPLGPSLGLSVAWSWAKHTYDDWVVDPSKGVSYSGNEMETAPRQIGRAALSFSLPSRPAWNGSLEWVHLGSYWMDAANTHRYPGHDLLNLRASAPLPGGLVAFARLQNLFDTRYAESSSFTLARGEEFAPGNPRSLFVGIQVDLRP